MQGTTPVLWERFILQINKTRKNLYFTWKDDVRHIIHEKNALIHGKIFLSLKNLLVLIYTIGMFILNCTRNHFVTYTTFPDLLNTVQFRALLIPSFLQFLLWISAYLRYFSIFSEGKPYLCRPKFLTWEADVFTTWLKKGKVKQFYYCHFVGHYSTQSRLKWRFWWAGRLTRLWVDPNIFIPANITSFVFL